MMAEGGSGDSDQPDPSSRTSRTVAILAGGQASRFGGRDKSLLLVGGRTIRDRQLAALWSLTDDILIVNGGHTDAARQPPDDDPRWPDDRGPGVPVPRQVADIVPGCGPLGGLHAALTEARGRAVFLVACDMPGVTAPFAAYLFSLAGDADIVVPQTERGYHPLCAVYTRACLGPVAARLVARRLRMSELVDEMSTRVVSAEEIDRFGARHLLLANVNTPAEYVGLEALQGHKL